MIDVYDNLINSDSSILFYFVDYFMKLVIQINIEYKNYTLNINNLLNKDSRFKNNVKYINKNYFDILYDYYSLNKKSSKIYSYGFIINLKIILLIMLLMEHKQYIYYHIIY